MSQCYDEYVDFMLKKSIGELKIKTDVEIENAIVVSEILNNIPIDIKHVIIKVYQGGDALADNVYKISVDIDVDQDLIWSMVKVTRWLIAKERGLI